MAPRLKVFTWSDGFHAFTVAASSRPKALAAWGIEGDIFKTGLAREIDDGPDREAALKTPGQVIERGLAIDVGKISEPAPKKAAAAKDVPKAAAPRKPSDRAVKKVASLEAELARLDADRKAELAALEKRRLQLEQEGRMLAAAHDRTRASLAARLAKARKAL